VTSYRQIEANRRNALKSTGPKTETGKQMSRRNAVRHGLTAETVIGALEYAEDYKAFETAVTADYDAQSAVERELVLRLASLLWRLRRATTMETGLFEIQAEHLRDYRQGGHVAPNSRDIIHAVFGVPEASSDDAHAGFPTPTTKIQAQATSAMQSDGPAIELAWCFLRLANLLTSRSIALAAMKQPYGARPAGSCSRLKCLIAANRRSECVVCGQGMKIKSSKNDPIVSRLADNSKARRAYAQYKWFILDVTRKHCLGLYNDRELSGQKNPAFCPWPARQGVFQFRTPSRVAARKARRGDELARSRCPARQ
jgi:hypothetical protein